MDVIVIGSKKLAKLPATLRVFDPEVPYVAEPAGKRTAILKIDISDTDMKTEADVLKRFKEYALVTEPIPKQIMPKEVEASIPVSAPTSV